MSDETTLVEGAGNASPADDVAKTEVTQEGQEGQEGAQPTAQEAADKAAKEEQEQQKKRNRTTEYIERLKRNNAELQRQLAEQQAARKPADSAAKPADEPRLENFNYDAEAYTRAYTQWSLERDRVTREEAVRQTEAARRNAEVSSSYVQRVADFAQEHPDFEEVVQTIPYDLPSDVIAAIMSHELGPQIAYHLGSNDDDAFQMAMVRPDMADAAIKRLASRLTATQKAPESQSKPLSKAPPPTPMVSGRSPTDTPPEKMTDEQWYQSRKAGK